MSLCSSVQKNIFPFCLCVLLSKKTVFINPSIPISSFVFMFFCLKKIYSPFVLVFLCLKKLLFLILYILLSKKAYPPYALLSKITQNPPVAFPPLSISIGSLPAATPVSASHNPRQYPFPAFPNGSRNPPTCPNHPH